MRYLLALVVACLAAPFASAQDDDLKAKAEKHKADVTSIRGLEFKGDVKVGVYSKAELAKFIKAEFERELPKEKAERYQRGYAKFGLVPADLNLYDAFVDLYSDSIAGFYDPRSKELRLITPEDADKEQAEQLKLMGIDAEAITLVHELTHAAQDQHYDLSTLPMEDETNDDLLMALKAVIEGDASAVGWKYGLGGRFNFMIGMINQSYKAAELPGKAGKLPAYLRESLLFPYGYGTDFVLAQKGELKGHSKLFEDFPLSSEQVLHPAKYYKNRDNPTLVTLPDLAVLFGGTWKQTFHNVHGEFTVRILLRDALNRVHGAQLGHLATRATEGWDGDRYSVLEDGKGGVMYVWYTTWDSEQDAKEFHAAYTLVLEKKYGKLARELPAERPDTVRFEGKTGIVYCERRGADVLVIDEATEAMLEKVAAIWDGTKKAEMTGFERVKKAAADEPKREAPKEAQPQDTPKDEPKEAPKEEPRKPHDTPKRVEAGSIDEAVKRIDAAQLKTWTEYLASDALEGRLAGDDGEEKAVAYIVNVYKEAKLSAVKGAYTYKVTFKEWTGHNTVAMIEGSDPDLKHEIVVVGGHHDHVGTKENGHFFSQRERRSDDDIWNGADDNASGTTVVMAVAKAFAESGLKPKRTILFTTFTFEEWGLVGSREYCKNPLFPLKDHVAMLNMDMVGRNPSQPLRVFGAGHEKGDRWEQASKDACEKAGLKATFIPYAFPGMGDSDHSSFRDQRIPAMFLHTGLHADYHKPSDHAEKLDHENMAKIGRAAMHIIWDWANGPRAEFELGQR